MKNASGDHIIEISTSQIEKSFFEVYEKELKEKSQQQ